MQSGLSDTKPAIEEILISLIRSKSIPERLSKFESLTSLVLNLSKRAISRKNPNLTKQELDLLFVKYHYGEELYEKLKLYLFKTANEQKRDS